MAQLRKAKAADAKAEDIAPLDEDKVAELVTHAGKATQYEQQMSKDPVLLQGYLESLERNGGLNELGKTKLAELKVQNTPPPPRLSEDEMYKQYDKLNDEGKYSAARKLEREWLAAEDGAKQTKAQTEQTQKDAKVKADADFRKKITNELQALSKPENAALVEKDDAGYYGVKFNNKTFEKVFVAFSVSPEGKQMTLQQCFEQVKQDLKL